MLSLSMIAAPVAEHAGEAAHAEPTALFLDPTGWVGNVRPFTMASSSQFRTPGPLRLGSHRYAAELNEVKALGSATSTVRTPTQTYIAKWWQSAPVLSWNEVARQLIGRTDLDAADSDRLITELLTPGGLLAADRTVVVATHHLPAELDCPAVRLGSDQGPAR